MRNLNPPTHRLYAPISRTLSDSCRMRRKIGAQRVVCLLFLQNLLMRGLLDHYSDEFPRVLRVSGSTCGRHEFVFQCCACEGIRSYHGFQETTVFLRMVECLALNQQTITLAVGTPLLAWCRSTGRERMHDKKNRKLVWNHSLPLLKFPQFFHERGEAAQARYGRNSRSSRTGLGKARYCLSVNCPD